MIAIVTDSTCDIPDDLVCEGGLFVVPALVHLGQVALRDGVELTRETFYEQLPGLPSIPTTSAPNPAAFLEAYEQALHQAHQVVSIHCASQLSSIFNSARLAAAQIASDRIHLIEPRASQYGAGPGRDGGAEDSAPQRACRRCDTLCDEHAQLCQAVCAP